MDPCWHCGSSRPDPGVRLGYLPVPGAKPDADSWAVDSDYDVGLCAACEADGCPMRICAACDCYFGGGDGRCPYCQTLAPLVSQIIADQTAAVLSAARAGVAQCPICKSPRHTLSTGMKRYSIYCDGCLHEIRDLGENP